MRLRLRTIFETATSPKIIRRAAALSLATILSLTTSFSSSQLNSFDQILNILPNDASAFNPSMRQQIDNPHYRINFSEALSNFRQSCANLPNQIQKQKDVEQWTYTNFENTNFLNTPLTFRDSIYNLAVNFTPSEEKDIFLTRLNQSLPNSQLLVDYLDRQRVILAERLQNDEQIRIAAQRWHLINDTSYKQRILQRISRITLDTLLPNKDIDYPHVEWTDESLPHDRFGQFNASSNRIFISGVINPSRYNFQFASDIVIHETMHHFQYVLLNWGMRGYFASVPDIDRYIAISNTSLGDQPGAIRPNINRPETFRRYRLSKNESMSWGFALIGSTISNPNTTNQLSNSLERNMFTYFDIRQPHDDRFHSDLLSGQAIPRMPENPHAGILPRACSTR